MSILKTANLSLSFALEIAMLAAFAYWGWRSGQGLLLKIVLGVGIPLLVSIFWGIFLAPKAARPVRNPVSLLLKTLLFGLAAAALVVTGRPTLAWVLVVLFVVNRVVDWIPIPG